MESLVGNSWYADVMHLNNRKISTLTPELQFSPFLAKLFLQENNSLTMIPPSLFRHMSVFLVLDLSHTSIQSLPPSISKLCSLEEFILRECSLLIELPPEIGALKNLKLFDLEGTEIMYLPKEIGKLEILQCLRVSFSAYADEYRDSNGIENIIPRTIMSKFSKLEELSISVSPDAKWWEVEVIEAILEKLHFLSSLKTLKLYLPTEKELQYFLELVNTQGPIYSTLQDFSLKFGHCKQLTSYLKTKVVDSFEKLEKCLKYENGEGSTYGIKDLIRHAKGLFICRHWTIEKLSIFDISRLKYCLLAECNEMHTIVDADEFYGDEMITNDDDGMDAFESLKYLAVHSMKKLQSIWKGPISRNSFFCLQVLALHTCPELTTIFTEGMLDKLHNLTVVIVEDCPKVSSLVSSGSSHEKHGSLLPNLQKILLLDLPELVSLSSGVYIAPRLDTLLVFNCLKLDYLSHDELSRHVKEIKGETEWWDALKNIRDLAYSRAFVQLKRDGYLMNQLAEDTNSLKEFHKLRAGEASSMSSSTFVSPDSQPSPVQLSSDETKKHLDWKTFLQYLKYQKPPVLFADCNSDHVVEFLKYLDKFGDIRVHVQSCVLFGHPNEAATCFCPLREAWGTLQAIATRLHGAYEKNKLPNMNRLDTGHVQSYLNEVRKSQENALGIPSKMHDFPILTVEEKSDYGWIGESSSSKKAEYSGTGTMDDEKHGFRSPGAVTESSKLTEVLKAFDAISTWRPTVETLIHLHDNRRKDIDDQYLEATDLVQWWFDSAAAAAAAGGLASYLHPGLEKRVIRLAMCRLMKEFRAILQVKIKSREDSFSVNPGSTSFSGTLTQGSSSTHEVHEDDYVKSNTMSPMVINDLRSILKRASSSRYIDHFVEIYIRERKTILQNRFLPFSFKIWSTYEIKRFECGVLESLIEVWIKSVKTSLEHLFASEKQLCEKIFQGFGTDREGICHEVIVQEYQIRVFNIIYTLSFSNPPPDKIFLILDLFQTLDHFLKEMPFFPKPTAPFQATVHTQLFTVLSYKIISSLSVFEMVLLNHESSVIFVGPVDPLARYVMSYLQQLCDHKSALMKLSLPKLPSIDDYEDDLSLYSEEFKGQSELSRHVIWIIKVVVTNLEGKAKLCEDGSAGHFFAMKNIRHIVHEIKGHQGLMEVVGDDYLGKLIQKFGHAKVNYLMLELKKIIQMRDYGAGVMD